MASTAATLKLTGLPKRQVSELKTQAKRLGLTPQEYLRCIVEERLAIAREARRRTFAELSASMRQDFRESGVTEDELDQIVNRARSRHHRR